MRPEDVGIHRQNSYWENTGRHARTRLNEIGYELSRRRFRPRLEIQALQTKNIYSMKISKRSFKDLK
jgi:hypothetical protein